ncbi:MAG: hypothetical protein ABF449_12320, partial [Ethanoligenens sp.]
MIKVYMLEHKRETGSDGNELIYSSKLIGFYSSRKKAEETIEKYKNIEGFKDYPDGFVIMEYEVDDNNI